MIKSKTEIPREKSIIFVSSPEEFFVLMAAGSRNAIMVTPSKEALMFAALRLKV